MKRRKPSEAEVDKTAGNSKKHPEAARSSRRQQEAPGETGEITIPTLLPGENRRKIERNHTKSIKKKSYIFQNTKNICTFAFTFWKCPDGGIGRRAGLKHQWIHFHAGSIPALGTTQEP